MTRVVFVSEHEGWLVGHRYIGLTPLRFNLSILYPSDQGQSWIDVSGELNRIAADSTGMVNDELIDVISEAPRGATVLTPKGKIYKTSDGGQSWGKVGFIPGEPESTCICRFGITRDGQFWLAGGTDETGKGMWGIYAVGQPDLWKRYRLGSAYFKDALFLSNNELLASGSIPSGKASAFSDQRFGGILYSSDGGRVWRIKEETVLDLLLRLVRLLPAIFMTYRD